MAIVTLDFTGLYYSTRIEFDETTEAPTVQQITERAQGQEGTNGGILIQSIFSSRGFLSTARVAFVQNEPKSRQIKDGQPFPPRLPKGIYGYSDTIRNNVVGDDINFTLSWQYYIFRNRLLISGRSGESTDRVIVPSGMSTSATPLQDGDIIRWRLVAIGGLGVFVENALAEMSDDRRANTIKNAIENNLTTREIAALIA